MIWFGRSLVDRREYDTTPLLFYLFINGPRECQEGDSENKEEQTCEQVRIVKANRYVFPCRLNNKSRDQKPCNAISTCSTKQGQTQRIKTNLLGGFRSIALDTPMLLADDPFVSGYEQKGGMYDVSSVKSGLGIERR
jgi:hypothetical protein